MDTDTIAARTATWQAILAYGRTLSIDVEDSRLGELEAALEHWQEANRRLYEGSRWSEIPEAEDEVERAMDAVLKPAKTSAQQRKTRERWALARQKVEELRAAHTEAFGQAREAKEAYERVLRQHF